MQRKNWGETIKFAPIPKNTTIKAGIKIVLAEGTVDVEKRFTTLPTETIVGLFRRENGASNFANVEHDLARLNGCKVRVVVEILEVPKEVAVLERELLKSYQLLLDHVEKCPVCHKKMEEILQHMIDTVKEKSSCEALEMLRKRQRYEKKKR